MSKGEHRGWLFVLGMALCHGLSDFYATIFTPLVETYRQLFALDEAGIAVVGAMVGVFGSMAQPLFGLWSDRARRGVMAAVGLAVSAAFMPLIGSARTVVMLAALLTLGASGVAAFHPSSAVLAASATPSHGLAVGVFLAGGGLGLACSPLVVPALVDARGLAGLWVLCVPGLALSIWVGTATRREPRPAGHRSSVSLRAMFGRATAPIWALFAMALLRSLVITVFSFFITVLGASRGWDRAASGRVLSAFLACSFLGGLLGGYLGQQVEPRRVLTLSCLLAAPLFFVFAASAGWGAVAAFAAAGLLFGIGQPLNISLAQALRPQRASTVSGLMMGLAWGVANLLLIPVGAVARLVGIEAALQAVAWLSAAAAGFVVFLPSRTRGVVG